MQGRLRALAYGLLLVLAFAAGWLVNSWRADARLSLLKQEHSEQVTRNSAAALHTYQRMEKQKDEAIKSAQTRAENLQADASRATAAADGLRKQLAIVPARITAATRSAVDEYAATAGELLSACTAEYREVAELVDERANDRRGMAAKRQKRLEISTNQRKPI